jgi:hypothetical protein
VSLAVRQLEKQKQLYYDTIFARCRTQGWTVPQKKWFKPAPQQLQMLTSNVLIWLKTKTQLSFELVVLGAWMISSLMDVVRRRSEPIGDKTLFFGKISDRAQRPTRPEEPIICKTFSMDRNLQTACPLACTASSA